MKVHRPISRIALFWYMLAWKAHAVGSCTQTLVMPCKTAFKVFCIRLKQSSSVNRLCSWKTQTWWNRWWKKVYIEHASRGKFLTRLTYLLAGSMYVHEASRGKFLTYLLSGSVYVLEDLLAASVSWAKFWTRLTFLNGSMYVHDNFLEKGLVFMNVIVISVVNDKMPIDPQKVREFPRLRNLKRTSHPMRWVREGCG